MGLRTTACVPLLLLPLELTTLLLLVVRRDWRLILLLIVLQLLLPGRDLVLERRCRRRRRKLWARLRLLQVGHSLLVPRFLLWDLLAERHFGTDAVEVAVEVGVEDAAGRRSCGLRLLGHGRCCLLIEGLEVQLRGEGGLHFGHGAEGFGV